MDQLRGLAVLLIVVFHVISVVGDASHKPLAVWSELMEVVAPLRLPMLFILSGMLVPRSLAKGLAPYVFGKVRRVLYPYFVWSFITIGSIYIAGIFVDMGNPPALTDPFWSPVGHMWFLVVLFFCYLVALLTNWVSPLALIFVGFSMSAVLQWLPPGVVSDFFLYMPMFMIGALLGARPDYFERLNISPLAGSVLVCLALLLTAGKDVFEFLYLPAGAWRLPVILAFFIGATSCLRAVSHTVIMRPLSWVGQRTLPIYAAHWPILVVVAYPLSAVIDRKALLVAVLFLVVGGSLVLAQLYSSSRAVRAIFEFPGVARKR